MITDIFPIPTWSPLVISDEWIAEIKNSLPELPDEKKKRFESQFGLPSYDAELLTSARELAEYFEACVDHFPEPKMISNWIMGSLLGLLNAEGKTIEDAPISAKNLAGLIRLISEEVISGKIAKTVFEEMAKTGKPAKEIVEEKGLVQVTDVSAIEDVVMDVISENPGQAEELKNGKTKLMGFFVGQVMRKTKGKANPKIVNQVIREKLGG